MPSTTRSAPFSVLLVPVISTFLPRSRSFRAFPSSAAKPVPPFVWNLLICERSSCFATSAPPTLRYALFFVFFFVVLMDDTYRENLEQRVSGPAVRMTTTLYRSHSPDPAWV